MASQSSASPSRDLFSPIVQLHHNFSLLSLQIQIRTQEITTIVKKYSLCIVLELLNRNWYTATLSITKIQGQKRNITSYIYIKYLQWINYNTIGGYAHRKPHHHTHIMMIVMNVEWDRGWSIRRTLKEKRVLGFLQNCNYMFKNI